MEEKFKIFEEFLNALKGKKNNNLKVIQYSGILDCENKFVLFSRNTINRPIVRNPISGLYTISDLSNDIVVYKTAMTDLVIRHQYVSSDNYTYTFEYDMNGIHIETKFIIR